MIQIVVGTNRPSSKSAKLASYIHGLVVDAGGSAELLDLAKLSLNELDGSQYFSPVKPKTVQDAVDKINTSSGVIFVVPEYNGSYPGVLKYFIDHWKYPECFEKRPVAFVGLGGMFGGLRPVEHLMQVMSYRNAYLFPERVFVKNASKVLENIDALDDVTKQLLVSQAKGFVKFTNVILPMR